MPELSESQRSELPAGSEKVPPPPTSDAQKSAEAFLQKLFAKGPHFEQSFSKICDLGCPRDEFGRLLWATCVLISFQTTPLINAGNLTKAQLKGLPKRIQTLAGIIKRLNATPLAPSNEVLLMPYAPEGTRSKAARDYLVQRYEMLPGLLMVYSYHIERFAKIARSKIKRLTTSHLSTIRVVHYVEHHTGSPRYGELAELLEQGCLIGGKAKNLPRFLTAEGLAKVCQRWGSAVRGANIPKISGSKSGKAKKSRTPER